MTGLRNPPYPQGGEKKFRSPVRWFTKRATRLHPQKKDRCRIASSSGPFASTSRQVAND
ncbi:hypothetical protein DSM3645_26939 [Blastopirellula marina DSM 3645]|uniref:Uncharacterized protein n=1 Tax=Blastopirellula marina DSM 3645 TaxID=314230 RepID=A3ZYB3_9BACT|nr:hypothetical protein DSM3645_26939 [Blastopirellula marina DSM 3645]